MPKLARDLAQKSAVAAGKGGSVGELAMRLSEQRVNKKQGKKNREGFTTLSESLPAFRECIVHADERCLVEAVERGEREEWVICGYFEELVQRFLVS